MSTSTHPIIILSDPNVKDAFSSTHSLDYIPASPEYFPALPGNISSDPSEDLSKYLLALLAISPFHDDSYMKVMQAYNATKILPSQKRACSRSSSSTSALPQVFKIGESSHKTSLERHKEQIETILNNLDELPLKRIEHVEENIKGLVNGRVIIQRDFDKLETELQKFCTQTVGLKREQMGHDDDIVLACIKISTLEMIIKDIQVRQRLDMKSLMDKINELKYHKTSTSAALAMNQAAIRKLVDNSVAVTLEAQAATMANTGNNNRNTRQRETPVARKCNNKEFMSCQPFIFKVPKGKQQCPWKSILAEGQECSAHQDPNVVTDTTYDIEMADGNLVRTNTIIQGFILILLNQPFEIDLMPINLSSFDVIVGMDWLSNYHARFICDEKVIHIPIDDETLIIRDDPSKTRLSLISFIKTGRYISMGYQVFIAQVMEKKSDEKGLEDIPAVREFLEVFPKDLPGLPLVHQVEFQIDLITRAAPVARAPYRLAPLEMQELSEQLQELADRVFIDDILIYSHNKEEHTYYLRIILELLKKEKLYVKFSRCDFWINIVLFLGHIIDSQGIYIDPANIEAIKNLASPTIPTEKCLSDESLVIPMKELRLDDKLNIVEEPIEIIDREVKQLKQSRIPIVNGNPQIDLQDKGVIDSGCSRHMTGNMSYLTDYEEIDEGYVIFGGNLKGGKITGKGSIRTDEPVNEEMDASLVRAATTTSSLEAEQDSGNINKTQSKVTPNKSSSQGTDLGGGPRCQEPIEDTIAQTRSENTKTTQAFKIDSLKRRVKKLEKKQRSRTYKLKRLYKVGQTVRVEPSDDEPSLGEYASKHGRINLHGEELFVAKQDETVVEKEVDAAQVQVSIAATTLTISINKATLAQALTELKHAKPKAKAKGIVFHKPKYKRAQKEEQEGNIALIETCDDIQAKVDVDYQLAQRLQAKEQEELTDEEKARLFIQFLKKRGKFFAAKREEEKRNKPPTITQQRSIMCTYLKNIKVESSKEAKTEVTEGSSKRAGEELEQENAKKQKIDDDKETAELKQLVKIIPDEEGLAIDVIPLVVKPPSIELVKATLGSTRPNEGYERVLWGDLKVMFDLHIEDEVWNMQQRYSVLKSAKAKDKKQREIVVVRDFSEVFPDDLFGLPPIWEIKFRIEVIPRAVPVAKPPYRLAPSE
nr:reverse transcriptase domain-containing protein [Tanacetum cinerariifolium]